MKADLYRSTLIHYLTSRHAYQRFKCMEKLLLKVRVFQLENDCFFRNGFQAEFEALGK